MNKFSVIQLFLLIFSGVLNSSVYAAAPQPPTTSSSLGSGSREDVLAIVKKQVVRRDDLTSFIEIRHLAEGGKFYGGREGQIKALNDFVLMQAFKNDARTSSITAALFEEALKARLYRYVSRKVKRQLEDTTITVEEQREYYDSHLFEFQAPERRKVRHIFKEVPEKATSATRAEVRLTVAQIRERLVKGESFADIAQQESEVDSKDKGGDLGWITSTTLTNKLFVDAVFGLPKGEISGVVETQYGFHIILVEDIEPPHRIPFETVVSRQNLSQNMLDYKQLSAKQNHIWALLASAEVTSVSQVFTSTSQTLFRVDGVPYTVADFLLYERQMPAAIQQQIVEPGLTIADEERQLALLNYLVHREAMAKGRIPESELEAVRIVQTQVLITARYLAEAAIAAENLLDDKKLRQLYEENQARLKTAESVEAYEIVFDAKIAENMNLAQKKVAKDAARQRAETVYRKIQQGMPFDEAAGQYTEDETAKARKGYVGKVDYGEGGAIFDETARKLAEGKYSEPVETKRGYMLLHVVKKVPARQKSFEESRDQLIQHAGLMAQEALEKKRLQEMQASGELVMYEERL